MDLATSSSGVRSAQPFETSGTGAVSAGDSSMADRVDPCYLVRVGLGFIGIVGGAPMHWSLSESRVLETR